MGNTMMNLKITSRGTMDPDDNKTCKSSKPDGLDLKKAHYTYET